MKQKNFIILGVIFLLILFVGGYFLLGGKTQPESKEETRSVEEEVLTLKPEDIGLQIIANANKKQVKFIINKLNGIQSIEYELSYEADSVSGDEQRISRGIAGEDVIKNGMKKYESKFLDLGSCSSGTCRYDTGVESVNLLLKLTKNDGKVYQVEDSLSLI
jgi:hypothetical protein